MLLAFDCGGFHFVILSDEIGVEEEDRDEEPYGDQVDDRDDEDEEEEDGEAPFFVFWKYIVAFSFVNSFLSFFAV